MNGVTTAFILGISAFIGPLAAMAHAPPAVAGKPVLVISFDASDVIEAAGGRIVGPTVAPLAALAVGDETFIAKLAETNLVLVRDGVWIAEICGART